MNFIARGMRVTGLAAKKKRQLEPHAGESEF
jgi:hypothetical protein